MSTDASPLTPAFPVTNRTHPSPLALSATRGVASHEVRPEQRDTGTGRVAAWSEGLPRPNGRRNRSARAACNRW